MQTQQQPYCPDCGGKNIQRTGQYQKYENGKWIDKFDDCAKTLCGDCENWCEPEWKSIEMPKEVKLAFVEIRKFHPNVTIVTFNKYGNWNYCDDSFNAPSFHKDINQEILETAGDSVTNLPCVYEYIEEEERFVLMFTIETPDPEGNNQTLIGIWDKRINTMLVIDGSHAEQCEEFTHPYTGETIEYSNHPKIF